MIATALNASGKEIKTAKFALIYQITANSHPITTDAHQTHVSKSAIVFVPTGSESSLYRMPTIERSFARIPKGPSSATIKLDNRQVARPRESIATNILSMTIQKERNTN